MRGLKQKWADMWEASPRRLKIARFGDDFPFSALLKRLSLLTRSQASLILQLRCKHFPLNSYLHKIKKVESDSCPTCHDDRDQEGRPYSGVRDDNALPFQLYSLQQSKKRNDLKDWTSPFLFCGHDVDH